MDEVMKINEIMLGDYVKSNGSIFRVEAISRKGLVRLSHNGVMVNMTTDCLWLQPAPLEKLHLAKNGFTADEEDNTFIYEDGYEVRVSFDGGCKELGLEPYIYLNINFAEKHLSMEIENLHQLQQAMRIMGCDKEIVL